jgi:hypothetical protein
MIPENVNPSEIKDHKKSHNKSTNTLLEKLQAKMKKDTKIKLEQRGIKESRGCQQLKKLKREHESLMQ